MLVEEIMSREIITITPEDSIHTALGMLRKHQIRHLPVVKEGHLVGILSDRDVREATPSTLLECRDIEILKKTTVKEIMTEQVLTAHPLDGVDEAARMMYEYRIGCLPVIRGNKLVAIITEADILRTLVEWVGTLEPGTTLEIEVPNRPGALAEITLAIKSYNINIVSVLMRSGFEPNTKLVTAKLQTMQVAKIIEKIEEMGFRVLFPHRGCQL